MFSQFIRNTLTVQEIVGFNGLLNWTHFYKWWHSRQLIIIQTHRGKMVTVQIAVLLTGAMFLTTEGDLKYKGGLLDTLSATTDNFDEELEFLVKNITLTYFVNVFCVCVLTEGNTYVGVKGIVPQLPTYFATVESGEFEEMLLEALDARCLAFVVRVADPVFVIRTMADLFRRSVQRTNRRYLILPLGKQSSPSVLQMREMAYMPDLVEASLLSDGGIVVATHRYVGVTTWKDRVELDLWRDGAWERGANLYPDKLSDMQGRPLVLTTFSYHPYAVADEGRDIYDGMELRLNVEFGRKHNMTCKFLVDQKAQWGEAYSNFTGNGVVGHVIEDLADFGFVALGMWYMEYQLMDYSYPYMHVGVACLAPYPDQLPRWMTPIIPFSSTIWGMVGGAVVCSAVALYIVTKLTRNLLGSDHLKPFINQPYSTLHDCTFRALGILVLEAPSSQYHESHEMGPTRYLVVCLLIFFLLVTSMYSSCLASVLVVPSYRPPINTVADLVTSDIHWAGTHEAWIYSIREAEDHETRLLYLQFQTFDRETLHRRSLAGDLAFPTDRLMGGQFAVDDYLDDESIGHLRLMKEDLYRERITTMARKGSPLVEPLNELIHRVLDTGLMIVWEGQTSRRFSSLRIQVAVTKSNQKPSIILQQKLHVKHVEGCFGLLMLGLGCSLFVFLMEIMIKICSSDLRSLR